MDLHGKKVAILVYNFFEESEFVEPRQALAEAGADVVVISPVEGELTAMQHVDKSGVYSSDLDLDTLEATDFTQYDGLVIPGGVINADFLRVQEKAKDFVRTMIEQGKPVAAICHGPWVLVSAGCVEGRKLTAYHTLKDDILNAGGKWVDDMVVVDGNLITSRNPDDLPAFKDALLEALADA